MKPSGVLLRTLSSERQAGLARIVAVLGFYLARIERGRIFIGSDRLDGRRVGVGGSLARVLRECEFGSECLRAYYARLAVALNEEISHLVVVGESYVARRLLLGARHDGGARHLERLGAVSALRLHLELRLVRDESYLVPHLVACQLEVARVFGGGSHVGRRAADGRPLEYIAF